MHLGMLFLVLVKLGQLDPQVLKVFQLHLKALLQQSETFQQLVV
jgi:hypothetical protein